MDGTRRQQGAVIYVGAEGGNDLFRRRDAAMTEYGFSDGVPFYLFPGPVNFMNAGAVETFISVAKVKAAGAPIAAVVLDTWTKMTPGADQNAVAPMSLALANVRLVMEKLGCSVIILHHVNSVGALRGSTAMAADADAILTVEKAGSAVTLRCVEMRQGPAGAVTNLTAEEVPWGNETALVLVPRKAEAKGKPGVKAMGPILPRARTTGWPHCGRRAKRRAARLTATPGSTPLCRRRRLSWARGAASCGAQWSHSGRPKRSRSMATCSQGQQVKLCLACRGFWRLCAPLRYIRYASLRSPLRVRYASLPAIGVFPYCRYTTLRYAHRYAAQL